MTRKTSRVTTSNRKPNTVSRKTYSCVCVRERESWKRNKPHRHNHSLFLCPFVWLQQLCVFVCECACGCASICVCVWNAQTHERRSFIYGGSSLNFNSNKNVSNREFNSIRCCTQHTFSVLFWKRKRIFLVKFIIRCDVRAPTVFQESTSESVVLLFWMKIAFQNRILDSIQFTVNFNYRVWGFADIHASKTKRRKAKKGREETTRRESTVFVNIPLDFRGVQCICWLSAFDAIGGVSHRNHFVDKTR